MIPIVSVIGTNKEEKTAAVVSLVKELKALGYRVGTIKHHVHDDFDIDLPGKASYRHREAGAEEVAIASPTMMAYIRNHDKDPGLTDVAGLFSSRIDIIITEGYAAAETRKVDAPIDDAAALAKKIAEEMLGANNE